ncbi:MAG TPA: hypothetical protein DCQ58_05645 [Saprospirales bacterium]|jgi:hypothetical protein|nr:hypothetical protein [Saprospirales bacterium]
MVRERYESDSTKFSLVQTSKIEKGQTGGGPIFQNPLSPNTILMLTWCTHRSSGFRAAAAFYANIGL